MYIQQKQKRAGQLKKYESCYHEIVCMKTCAPNTTSMVIIK